MSFSLGGLSFGASTSKTKSASNTTGSSTTRRLVPEWATSLTENAAGLVNDLLGQDPYSLTAPAHALQSRAANGAANLNDWSEGYGQSADMMRRVANAGANTYDASTYETPKVGASASATAGSLLENLDAYMSPYRRDVVDAALADYDHASGQTRAQQDLNLAGSGAFGGSGAALTRSMTEDSLVRGRATTSANLRDQMFNRGAALSDLDADRRNQVSMGNVSAANAAAFAQAQLNQQAGQFNAEARNTAGRFNAGQGDGFLNRHLETARALNDTYDAQSANQRANIATQAGLGDTFRGIDQQTRLSPVTQAQQVVAMLSGLPISLFTGEQTDRTEQTKGTSKKTDFNANASLGWK